MEQDPQPVVLGLPEDFELTADQARALGVDEIIAGASFEHGLRPGPWCMKRPLS